MEKTKIEIAVEEFKDFLKERTYTDKERNKTKDFNVKNDMDKWNRLVSITEKKFDRIFKKWSN